jgi:hypothetical protein
MTKAGEQKIQAALEALSVLVTGGVSIKQINNRLHKYPALRGLGGPILFSTSPQQVGIRRRTTPDSSG